LDLFKSHVIVRETKRLPRNPAYKETVKSREGQKERERERERGRHNDEITIKFRFTSGLGEHSNPQSLPDVHGDFPCPASFVRRKIAQDGSEGLLARSISPHMAVGHDLSVHERRGYPVKASVESNGKRGFICRENTPRNEIKHRAPRLQRSRRFSWRARARASWI